MNFKKESKINIKKIVCRIALLFSVLITAFSCQLFSAWEPQNDRLSVYQYFWQELEYSYPYFELRELDKQALYHQYESEIKNAESESDYKSAFYHLIQELSPGHIFLYTYQPMENIEGYFSRYGLFNGKKPPSSEEGIGYYLDRFQIYQFLSENYITGYIAGPTSSLDQYIYGRFTDYPQYAYLGIKDFQEGMVSKPSLFKKIMASLADSDGLVLDLRDHSGGDMLFCEYVGGFFVPDNREYIYCKARKGPGKNDFTLPFHVNIGPSVSREDLYLKDLVVITDGETASAGEYLCLMLRTRSNTWHIGTRTAAYLDLYRFRTLPNGWVCSFPYSLAYMPDGTHLARGILPQLTVKIQEADILAGRDPQLEMALSVLEIKPDQD